jgi:hypothetical protein
VKFSADDVNHLSFQPLCYLDVCVIVVVLFLMRAWGTVVVKALRCWSEGLGIDPRWCRWGFFPKLPTEPCALVSTQPLKMSTRILLGVKAVGA